MRECEKIYVEMPIPEEIRTLHCALGGNLFVVGGSVRDFWHSIEHNHPFVPKDFDLVTGLHPDQVIVILKTDLSEIEIREVGKSFGVVLVTSNGKDFEIATFREDAKTGDGRRPDYVTFSTMDKDAERRDLVINALYYDIGEKCIIDFFGGIHDIRNKIVRFVGDVIARIHEDKLRIMRFVRFHCRVNSGGPESVDKDTRDAIRNTKLRPQISGERIRDEFLNGITSCLDIKKFILILEDLGLLNQIFPNLNVTGRLSFENRVPESLIAQILRSNDSALIKKVLLEEKYTAQEATNVAFLLRLRHWDNIREFVEFKKAVSRTSLEKKIIEDHITVDGNSLTFRMLNAPYPTVNGDDVMEETGLVGKALGDEILRREVKNFDSETKMA